MSLIRRLMSWLWCPVHIPGTRAFSRRFNTMAVSVDRIHALKADCLELWKYINCIHRLFGSPAEAEAQAQTLRMQQLKGQIEQLRYSRDPEARTKLIRAFEQEREIAANKKEEWKRGPFPVLCDDATLEALALRVEHGPPVLLSKGEIEKHFDLSRAIHFWQWLPEYTRVLFAFGMYWSCPDADFFRSMAFFHDEAVRASQGVETALSEMANGRDRVANLFRGLSMKKLFACQAIVNACLLVEAFLNGLASVALSRKAGSFSPEEESSLQDTKHHPVSTQCKMAEWVKLMSPRKVGLEKGRNPYQDFNKILDLRHAIVHLGTSKIETYESLGHEEATLAADAAVAVIREICRCLAVDATRPGYPGWLKERGPDGFFQSDFGRAVSSV
jgi:hypothetical protein